jgi:hypothetical protein
MKLALAALSLLLGSAWGANTGPQVLSEYGKVVDHCQVATSPDKTVWLIKQWHLGPSVDTKNHPEKTPQEMNQTAIYKQLNQWIQKGELTEVIAEGCAGELTEKSELKINGWDIPALKAELKNPNYPNIVTSVPLKLEAQYGDKLLSQCGDDEGLIKESNLALSDARAAIGFAGRLQQMDPNSSAGQSYLKSVIEIYKLSKSTTLAQAQKHLKQELKAAIMKFEAGTEKRNQKVVEAIQAAKAKNIAVVFGGIHADGIKVLLDKAHIACQIIEPVGYQDNEAELLKKLNEMVK